MYNDSFSDIKAIQIKNLAIKKYKFRIKKVFRLRLLLLNLDIKVIKFVLFIDE